MSRKDEMNEIAKSIENMETYSSILRSLNKEKDSKKTIEFMKRFKESFDAALIAGEENEQDIALNEASIVLAFNCNDRFIKLAQAAIGISRDPNQVGKIVADILKVILFKIPNKATAYNNMKTKVLNLNVADIASTNLPITAAYGQGITLIKTLLNGYSPEFIKKVLINIAKYL